jgi:hypothetical protein
MATVPTNHFTIESSIELIADHYTAYMPNADLFLTADRSDRITLKMGLRTDADPAIVAHIDGGKIDEYEVIITPDNQTSSVRGRDQSAVLLDTYYRMRYRHIPVTPSTVTDPRTGETLTPQGTESVADPFGVPEVFGYFTARKIAQDICDFVGLSLSWEVRDYTFQSDFDAVGRAADLIKRLVEPWTLVEPYRAMIVLQGSTLIVRHRQLPTKPLVADYTYDIKTLKRGSVTIRKRPTKKIGLVTLRGMKTSVAITKLTPNALGTGGIGGVFTAGQEDRSNSSTTFDDNGNVLSQVITTFTYQMPTNILLRQVKEVFEAGGSGIALVSRETVAYTWTQTSLAADGPVSSPLPLEKSTITEGFTPDGVFTTVASETVESEYDAHGFMRSETTLRKALNVDTGNLENSEMIVRSLAEMGPLLVHEIVEKSVPKKNDAGVQVGWTVQQRDEATQAGHRPGGPGRAVPKFRVVGPETANQLVNVAVQQTVNSDPDAAPVDYTNENLSLDDLNFLMSLFVAADLLWEYEVVLKGPIVAQLHRTMAIEITGLKSSKGDDITLPVLSITAINSDYDNSSEKNSRAVMDPIRAFGWRST